MRPLGGSRRRPPAPAAPRPTDDAEARRGAAAFDRWQDAVSAVRANLRTPDGQWFVDALVWPVVRMSAGGGRHGEGPVPPVEVMTAVFAALGEEPDRSTLHALVAADAVVLRLDRWPHAEPAHVARFRESCAARVPGLRTVPTLEEDVAHRTVREELSRVEEQIPHYARLDVRTALASARWWPGRGAGLAPRSPERGDPLRLAYIGRYLMEASPPGSAWYDALGEATALSRAEGIPPVDPARWLLSALRYRAEALADLPLEAPPRQVVRPDMTVHTVDPGRPAGDPTKETP